MRGKTRSFAKITLRAEKCLENNETRDSLLGNKWPPLPTSPPESPKGGRFGGRGEELVGTLTQGGASGSCPSLALGYLLTPLQGSQDEAAASLPLHFLKNVQSPLREGTAFPHIGRRSRSVEAGVGVSRQKLLRHLAGD